MAMRFDYNPRLSDDQLATLHAALQWWLERHQTRPPRAIYWDATLDKRDLGGHFVGLTNKIFLNPNLDMKELLRCLFHELWHMKRWHEGGAESWFQKGANLFVLHVSREEEESYVDAQAMADREEFLRLCEPKKDEVSQHNEG